MLKCQHLTGFNDFRMKIPLNPTFLISMCSLNFMQRRVEHEKSLKTSESDYTGFLMTQLIFINHFRVWPRGYKTFFMLNSTELEIYPADKWQNANNCWHVKSCITSAPLYIPRQELKAPVLTVPPLLCPRRREQMLNISITDPSPAILYWNTETENIQNFPFIKNLQGP